METLDKIETLSEEIILKKDQKAAYNELLKFILDSESKVFILKGYAGTGKTTMMKVLIEELSKRNKAYELLASTGRAAKILSDKAQVKATTVHSLIYSYNGINGDVDNILESRDKYDVDNTGQLLLNFELTKVAAVPGVKERYYIVDESSMISDVKDNNPTQALFGSGKLLTDLLNYDSRGKFIFVGDICQLPPVGQDYSPALSCDYFKNEYNVKVYEFELKEIVRQKAGNDIIDSSKKVRNLFASNPGVKWVKFPLRGYSNIKMYPNQAALLRTYIDYLKRGGYNSTTLICQSNKNCLSLTELIRPSLNFAMKQIQAGDLLLITQNNYISGLMNGDMIEVVQIGKRERRANLTFVNVEFKELISSRVYSQLMIEDIIYGSSTNLSQSQQKELFIDFFKRMKEKGIGQKHPLFAGYMMEDQYLNALRGVFGYALTCHKAQGGEWDDVFLDVGKSILFHERPAVYQWIYTAMTRAGKQLHIVDEWWFD